MWGSGFGGLLFSSSSCLAAFLLLLLSLDHPGPVTAQTPKSPWQTLTGNAPVVIAKGGFSGIFPDSSDAAYKLTYIAGSSDTISWCDVRLTKDGVGICLPELTINNGTNIQVVYSQGEKNYLVNGVPTSGWFSVDYSIKDLSQVSLIQGVFSRTDKFDASLFPILAVEDVQKQVRPPALWLNIQHDMFYRQHNLSMRSYLLSLSKRVILSYVSSPEVIFLSSIAGTFKRTKTKFIFRFLDEATIEPSTNQTYGALLKNLTFIKTFASGILVPKQYIWPVTSDLYLQPYTSVVLDAHKEGLEVYASGFANDAQFSYNYSYDPLAEYLSFIDNGIFSVDGVLTDFPITASEAIGCFSQTKANSSEHGKPVVFSHNGASGMYADCTDLAYQQAVKDGADFIDCPVQVTQDGTLICMSSINLIDVTTVTTSPFSSLSSVIPEIQDGPGIFTLNLTWEDISKNLKPTISSPEIKYQLHRNPRYKNAGKFMRLSDFLDFAKDKALSGVLISIENAAFLAEKLGYSVTDGVIKALKDSAYNNQTVQEVMIQSSNSSVLVKFKEQTKYKLVYMVDESIRAAAPSSVADIKQFAHSVAVSKQSIFPESQQFVIEQTELVNKLKSAGLNVYVYLLMNEFVSQPWDFFSDPIVEINQYVQGAYVDGIITDFPGTAAAYKRNACSKLGDKAPNYMLPVQVGGLLGLMTPEALPPALAPMPVLEASDVVEPPLMPASGRPSAGAGENAGAPASQPSGEPPRSIAASVVVSLAMLCGFFVLI
ncbi:glycerophosphodiester phosphodiesterase GDPDL3-like [Phoenix dactylifera]|uniref:glycerophosphodiester phosphodiesterase n=1 Tax=Phoenix dactylifera TaxID=42345 RepID=A0A8B7BPS9_PHODC|nr:glycerophosphodiester phosphodiesterase GDPDL3-like [Phoenix dactylifera]